jgi:hypothetical protein
VKSLLWTATPHDSAHLAAATAAAAETKTRCDAPSTLVNESTSPESGEYKSPTGIPMLARCCRNAAAAAASRRLLQVNRRSPSREAAGWRDADVAASAALLDANAIVKIC